MSAMRHMATIASSMTIQVHMRSYTTEQYVVRFAFSGLGWNRLFFDCQSAQRHIQYVVESDSM